MRVFGYDFTVRKAQPRMVDDSRGWRSIWDPSYPTGFQLDVHVDPNQAQANWVVWACQTLIAGDLGKMRVKLMRQRGDVWTEFDSPSFSPFFRRPNRFQTWQQFEQHRALSKLRAGNSYALKERDARGVVARAYVLDPGMVEPMVDPESGEVFYQLNTDELAGVGQKTIVPASEIIHDRDWCLYHPLVGLSPLYACGLAAMQGMDIQSYSRTFFRNGAKPSGVLTSPGFIDPKLAQGYKDSWESQYGGANRGRTAVLGNGLKYEPISENAVDSEIIAQLKLSAEMVCSAYHVPGYKVGVGVTPTYQNAEVLEQIYYKNCLQVHIEGAEALWNDELGLTALGYRAEYDLDDLMRMDSAAQMEFAAKAVEKSVFSINEARARFGKLPVKGGEEPLSQQQYYPLSALIELHDKELSAPAVSPAPPPVAANDDGPTAEDQQQAKSAVAEVFA